MALELNFLALFMTIFLVTGGESRRLLEASEATPVHSELPEPTLPVPKVEFPPISEIPNVESPPIPEEELPPVPEIPKEELPPLPEIPKKELPPMPEISKVESPPIYEIPKLPIPKGIPELPFAHPHAENSP